MSKSDIMETSIENAKITDSGYSNSCSNNSQSQKRTEELTQKIKKRKDTECNKKSKTTLAINPESKPGVTFSTVFNSPLKTNFDKRTDEQAVVGMMDAMDTRVLNYKMISNYETELLPQSNPLDDSNFKKNDEFCVVISMKMGFVIYTTFSQALGYSEDDWVRKSFLDFIHFKDREIFINYVTKITILCQKLYFKGNNEPKVTLFCRLQNKDDLESNQVNGITKVIQFTPFKLTLIGADLRNCNDEEQLETMFLVVKAQSVQSAYKESEETIISSIFSTRHTATCRLSHVDLGVVQYLGYLPQDMVGRSFFDFYHPEDLPIIKDIYETIVKRDGKSFKSKPYRFLIKNGDFVVLETKWSAYFSPWTNKLDHIQCQHRVLKGPANIKIFRESDKLNNFSEEVLKESALIQKEILALLQEKIQRNQEEYINSYEYQEPFLMSLLKDVLASRNVKDPMEEARSFSGPHNPLLQKFESVILREISPHREYEDSKSSTETPPSYSLLNYNENLERFFKSNPVVTAAYSSDENSANANSGFENGKNDNSSSERKYVSPNGESGTDSAGNLSNDSNNQINSNRMGQDNYSELPMLTESMINKHNKNMEKIMVQKHKELRSNIKKSDKLKESRMNANYEKTVDPNCCRGHGIKRCRSSSRDKNHTESSKQKVRKIERTNGTVPVRLNNTATFASQTSPSTPNYNFQAMPKMPGNPSMSSFCYNYYTMTQSQNTQALPSVSAPMMQQNSYLPYVGAGISSNYYLIHSNMCRIQQEIDSCRKFLFPASTPSVKTPAYFEVNLQQQKIPTCAAMSVNDQSGSSMSISTTEKKVTDTEAMNFCKNGDYDFLNDGNIPSSNSGSQKQNDDTMEGSSTSSFYSSFLSKSNYCKSNTDSKQNGFIPELRSNLSIARERLHFGRQSFDSTDSIESQLLISWKNRQQELQKEHQPRREMIRKEPPWMEGVQMSPALIYQYQVPEKSLQEVLEADRKALMNMKQPALVCEQRNQLFTELELQNFEARLNLEEPFDYDENIGDPNSERQCVSLQRFSS